MKAILKLLILLFLFNNIYSQSVTFKKVYPGFTTDDPDRYKIICKPFNNDKSFIISPVLLKINSTGDIINIKEFTAIGGSKSCFIFNDDTSFTLFGNGYNSKNLSKLDTSLNVIFAKQYYSIDGPFWGMDRNIINPTFDKGFIFSGGKHDTTIFVKTDSLTNITWCKYFTPIQGGIQDIVQTQDSGFAIAVNLVNVGASLIRTNKNGNMLWAKSYFRPKGFIHNVLENADGTMLITGNVDSLAKYGSQFNSSPLFFVKLDQSGNILWAKTFGDTINRIRNFGASYTKHTRDGGYITLATLAKNNWLDDLLLIKTDANGDTLWIRVHGSNQSYDAGQSIEQLNDKGYIITGMTNDNLGGGLELYLIRSDSLGHTASLCEEYSLPLALNNITVNDSNITVNSISHAITTSIITDYSYDGVTTYAYDGCVLDNIKELMAEQTAPLLIYPNPTDGLFAIETKMNTPIKTDIEIYNVNSKRVYYCATNKSLTNINLSGMAKGLYFIRMRNEKWVKSGKVMVE